MHSNGHYVYSTGVMVSQAGGCRVMAFCEPLGCVLASQPSAHSSLIPGETPYYALCILLCSISLSVEITYRFMMMMIVT